MEFDYHRTKDLGHETQLTNIRDIQTQNDVMQPIYLSYLENLKNNAI